MAPHRARLRWAARDARSVPSNVILPDAGACRPAIARNKVDLPLPDSPTMPSVSPLAKPNETPLTALNSRPLNTNLQDICSTRINGVCGDLSEKIRGRHSNDTSSDTLTLG